MDEFMTFRFRVEELLRGLLSRLMNFDKVASEVNVLLDWWTLLIIFIQSERFKFVKAKRKKNKKFATFVCTNRRTHSLVFNLTVYVHTFTLSKLYIKYKYIRLNLTRMRVYITISKWKVDGRNIPLILPLIGG